MAKSTFKKPPAARTVDLSAILASKRRHRARVAALPIAEKLRLLDALRERTLVIRRAGVAVARDAEREPGRSPP